MIQKSPRSNCKSHKDKKTLTQQHQRHRIVNQQNLPQTPYQNISHHQKRKSKNLIVKSL